MYHFGTWKAQLPHMNIFVARIYFLWHGSEERERLWLKGGQIRQGKFGLISAITFMRMRKQRHPWHSA
jgi:hypothetical protein